MKILIVIPTYNEAENIARLLGRLMNVSPDIHVLVVDDNSPDGTGKLVEVFSQSNQRIHILHRQKKQGLGPAYLAGFKWGLARDYDAFMEMDADLSHRPRYLGAFFEKLKEADLVIGSRWIKGGRIANWPITRVLLSRMASVYCQLVLGVRIHDMTAGYKCYRRRVLETIDLDSVHSDGYSFQIEMKYRALLLGFKLSEIPILFTDRKAGDSKISRRIVFEALFLTWMLKFATAKLKKQRRDLNQAASHSYE